MSSEEEDDPGRVGECPEEEEDEEYSAASCWGGGAGGRQSQELDLR